MSEVTSNTEYWQRYEDYVGLVYDTFEECQYLKMPLESSVGRTIYQLESMISDDFSKIIIYTELCYLFSTSNLYIPCKEIYDKLRDEFSDKSSKELLNFLLIKTRNVTIRTDTENKLNIITNFIQDHERNSGTGSVSIRL
jgi:hypothetical protein